MKRWKHQTDCVQKINEAIAAGEKRVVLCSATGTGKSVIMEDCARGWVSDSLDTVVITNRRFLFEQLVKGFRRSGLPTRTIASGWPDHGRERFTVCMFQTLTSRGIAPPAKRVLFDECHNETGESAVQLLKEYEDCGATAIGVTASALGVSHLYDHLILGADRSDGRKCGSLVMAQCFGGGQLDMAAANRDSSGEYRPGEVAKKAWNKAIYGQVVKEHLKINPEGRPTLLFAPGKKESNYFVDQFEQAGVSAASITSDGIYWQGETIPASPKNRQHIKEAVASGAITVLCNRFILREGIDIPELSHCILACPFGSILSYTQSVGRVLRNHDSLPEIDFGAHGGKQRGVTIQDHGGNFWRHGSPNADLASTWKTYFHDSPKRVTDDREKKLKQKELDRPDDEVVEGREETPTECPACGAIQFVFKNRRCYRCDNEIFRSGTRRVFQTNGELTEQRAMHDVRTKRRKKDPSSEMTRGWKSAYYSAKNSNRNFNQARGYLRSGRVRGFEHLKGVELPLNLPLMPLDPSLWSEKVSVVPGEHLHTEDSYASL